MDRIEKFINSLSLKSNWVASGGLIIMMLLTTLEVFLRTLNMSIPGSYEIIGLLGTIVVSFSLAYTSIEKGHISVDIVLEKLPPRVVKIIDFTNAVLATILFAALAWQSFVYGIELKQSGEVSMTVQIPTYPFIFGIGISAILLCGVLLIRSIKILKGVENP